MAGYTFGYNDDESHPGWGPQYAPGPFWSHEDAVTDAQGIVRSLGDDTPWVGEPEIGGAAWDDATETSPATEQWGFTVILHTEQEGS